MLLRTFVHISDLHIGQLDGSSLEARVEFWKRWPCFTGVLGHAADSLADLDVFFAPFLADRKAHLIVTGDLTATGHPQEFDIANQYLGGVLRSPDGDHVGLGVHDWVDRAIPGNHDHWAGLPVPIGGPTSAFCQYFPTFPLLGPTFLLRPGLELRILRIDTDAGVHSYGLARIRAMGSFLDQLTSLQRMMNALGAEKDEIRVLCLHHSQSYRGPVMEMEEPSRIALEDFVLKNRVSVLLCGHVHRPPRVGPMLCEALGPSATRALEARCGTTTQIDPTIDKKKGLNRRMDASWQNSLLVHRLFERGSEIHWETELFLQGRGGFVASHALRQDVPTMTVWKVWPWPPKLVSIGTLGPQPPPGPVTSP